MNDRTPSITRREWLGSAGVAGVSLLTAHSAASAAPAAAFAHGPALPMKVLLRAGLPEDERQRLRAISPQITLLTDRDALADADAIFGSVNDDELAAAKKLKWVQYPAAGVENVLTPTLIESDVVLTNAKGCFGPEIAEHAMGMLLSLTRGIAPETRRMSAEQDWSYEGPPLIELSGLTMGIIGAGGIGLEIARRARAFGMRVLAVDAEPYTLQHLGGVVDELRLVDDGLDDLLARANVLVSAVPLTARSRGMLGAEQFGMLPKGAYFINVSRGKVADTEALAAALQSGHLAGAGLDVTDPEPLPKGHALWSMTNVVVTSHIAGRSPQGTQRQRDLLHENVRRCARGLPLMNVVDKQKGY